MTTWITVCDTCKREGWRDGDPTHGECLARLIEPLVSGAVAMRRHSCLMGCTHGCNVAIQAADKTGYSLGRFEPTPEAAEALVAWARLHAESPAGQVPYRQWPQPVKGHFVARHPPLPA